MILRTRAQVLNFSPLNGAICAFLLMARLSFAQVAITEVMANPDGVDSLWEWLEIRNTTAAPLDLHGWVFDDDDDAELGQFNISNFRGNTIVPAGGVAVLYPGDELNFMPQRFTDAWGSGITLIPVDGLSSLGNEDAIGFWPSRALYVADTIANSSTSPRRTFVNAAAKLDYSAANGFPTAASGHSIAWSGNGSWTDSPNWIQSEVGILEAFASQTTTIDSAPINSTNDLGSPGVTPASATATGLRFAEVMFAPKSPLVTIGYSESDFEWIEVANRTGAAIDFEATPYVLDDIKGSQLNFANITEGTLAAGAVGILYKLGAITPENMQAMWGNGLTYIPVNVWPSLTNSGSNTLAIWDSETAYNSEPVTGVGRTTQNSVAAITYDTATGQGWPSVVDGSSIRLRSLTSNPNVGANWARSFIGDGAGTKRATTIYQSTVDHPGGDVGSPGFAPPIAAPFLAGDYNGNGTVDAADYVLWRAAFDSSSTLPNDTTPGSVTAADYDVWRANFGRTSASSSALESAAVPEPAGTVMILSAIFGFGWHALSIRRRANNFVSIAV